MQIPNTEYHHYYKRYIEHAQSYLSSKTYADSLSENLEFYTAIPNDLWAYRYAKDKWSIADILLHINDTERIMAYRALRLSRGDDTPLAGFEQDDYVLTANANNRTPKSLIEEFKTVRLASLSLFESFSEKDTLKMGTASGTNFSVRALQYIVVGHQIHHHQIITERYL